MQNVHYYYYTASPASIFSTFIIHLKIILVFISKIVRASYFVLCQIFRLFPVCCAMRFDLFLTFFLLLHFFVSLLAENQNPTM